MANATITQTLDSARAKLRANGYDSRHDATGVLIVPVGSDSAGAALAEIRDLLGDGYRADFNGDSNTDADGETTEDISVEVAAR